MTKALLPLLLLLAVAAAQAQTPEMDLRLGSPVDFYTVAEARQAPLLDGRLDDPAWQQADPLADLYAFGLNAQQQGSFPAPAVLRTAVRLLSTREGLWLGFDCYDDMSKVNPRIQARDNGDIWTEDSCELYVVTDPTRLSMRKFTISALGTQADMEIVDARLDQTWSDLDWQARTARLADRWTAELFFPWSSLGGRYRRGDVLPFGLTRFSWTTGGLVGACWGAAMSHPFNYRAGMLLFGEDPLRLLGDVASLQDRYRGTPWHTWEDDRLVTVTSLGEELRRLRGEVGDTLGDLAFALTLPVTLPDREAQAKELAALQGEAAVLATVADADLTRETWRTANALLARARDLRARLRRDLLLTGTASP